MRYPSIEPELWRSLSEQERGQRQFQYVRKWALVAAACRVLTSSLTLLSQRERPWAIGPLSNGDSC